MHNEARKLHKSVFEIIVFLIAPFLWKGTSISKIRKMYDNVLVLGVGLFMMVCGLAIWGLGICGVIFTIKHAVVAGIMLNSLALLLLSVLVISFGSLIIVAAMEFSTETNMRKIYEYSACAIALMSCIVSVIALIVTVLLNMK